METWDRRIRLRTESESERNTEPQDLSKYLDTEPLPLLVDDPLPLITDIT